MKRVFYMCGIEWQHELGETISTTYATIEDLKEDHTCWEGCGIVKLTIEGDKVSKEWVHPQNLFKDSVSSKDIEKQTEEERIEIQKKHLSSTITKLRNRILFLEGKLNSLKEE